MIYVVAFQYADFSRWLRDEMELGNLESSTEVKYIRDHASLMGARLEEPNDDIVFLPGWQLLEDATAIADYAEIMRAEFPYRLTSAGKVEQKELQAEFERVRSRMLQTKDPFVECD